MRRVGIATIAYTLLTPAAAYAQASPTEAPRPGLFADFREVSRPAAGFMSSAERVRFDVPAQAAARPVVARLMGGVVISGGEAGVLIGAGFGARPFENQQLEVIGDLSFVRGGVNSLYGSGSLLYHFASANPDANGYAGGGAGFFTGAGSTTAFVQVLGGWEFNKAQRPMRAEGRILFADADVAVAILFLLALQ